jgi:CMP-2-keto-3-deoxyoctulosonic acid synthetase
MNSFLAASFDAAAQLKYKDLAEIFVPSAGIVLTGPDRGKEAFGRLYFQKIVQLQFDLPIPPTSKIRQFMKHLAATPAAGGGRDGRSSLYPAQK